MSSVKNIKRDEINKFQMETHKTFRIDGRPEVLCAKIAPSAKGRESSASRAIFAHSAPCRPSILKVLCVSISEVFFV